MRPADPVYRATLPQFLVQSECSQEMMEQVRRQLIAEGYVETFPDMWEMPAATQELLCADTMRKDTDWMLLQSFERSERRNWGAL